MKRRSGQARAFMRKTRQDIHKNQDKIKQDHCFKRGDIARMEGLSKKVGNMARERETTQSSQLEVAH